MEPVDLFRRDGVTAYSHDVQVDAAGIAWVSGDGGTRGYWTERQALDSLDKRVRAAPRRSTRSRTRGGGLPRVRHRRRDRRLRAQRLAAGRAHGAEGRPALSARRAAARHRGGLRPAEEACREPRPVHDRLAEGQLRRRGVALDAGEPVPAEGGRQLEPVREGGLTPARRAVRPERQLLLRPLLRRGRQHGDLRLVRRGHALPRHLRSGEPDPVRVLAARRRHRLGVLPARWLRLHSGPHPRRGRAEADGRREGGPQQGQGGVGAGAIGAAARSSSLRGEPTGSTRVHRGLCLLQTL